MITTILIASIAFASIIAGGGREVREAHAQAPQALYIIDKPTAGILPHGAYMLRGRTGPESSFMVGLRIGFRDIFQVGLSLGMQRLFEHGDPDLNEHIGLKARVRILQEGVTPALAVGFDSQGSGVFHNGIDRYDRKSPGVYGVISKNYALVAGEFAVHGGGSWSLEDEDDSDPNIFAGAEFTLFQRLSFLLDADAALNDNSDDDRFGRGGIFVDAGVRWYHGESLVLTLIFRDLTDNFAPSEGVGREFELAIIDFF
jgi:hypothetical protein